MWILALLLLSSSAHIEVPVRISGTIVVDRGEVPVVTVNCKNGNASVVASNRSFSNGTFYVEYDPENGGTSDPFIASLGAGGACRFIEVVDPRFEMVSIQLALVDYSKPIIIKLKPNLSSGESDVVAMLRREGKVPSRALNEFVIGMTALGQQANRDSAADHFKKAIALYPRFYEAYYQLGLEQARKHDNDAIRTLSRAVELNPAASEALSALGRLWVESKEFQKAVDTLSRIAVTSLTAEDHYNLGVSYLRLDNPEAAQENLLAAIGLAPGKNPPAYVELANAYGRNNNPAAALASLEDYLQLFPNDRNHKLIEDAARKLHDSMVKPKP
jgi:tetratricopeptide (TPR) repeat protein